MCHLFSKYRGKHVKLKKGHTCNRVQNRGTQAIIKKEEDI
jgi:hypothetical protein